MRGRDDAANRRKALRQKLEGILGSPIEFAGPNVAKTNLKAYVAVKNDTQPGGGLVYVLDTHFMSDRELTRQGLKEQFGAEHVWFSDELTNEQTRMLIGRKREDGKPLP